MPGYRPRRDPLLRLASSVGRRAAVGTGSVGVSGVRRAADPSGLGGGGTNSVAGELHQIDEFTITDDGTDTFTLSHKPLDGSWNVSMGWPFGEDRYTIVGKTLTILDPTDTFRRIAASGPRTLRVQYDYLVGMPGVPADLFNDWLVDLQPGEWTLNGGGTINHWTDASGNDNHGEQSSSVNSPAPISAHTPGGQDAAYFTNPAKIDFGADFTSGLTEGEIFWVLRSDDSFNNPGLHTMRVQTHDHPYFNYGNDRIQDAWGSATDHLFNAPDLYDGTYHVVNVVSRPGEWTLRLDGVQLFTTGTNTVQWQTGNPAIGISGLAGGFPATYYTGWIAEVKISATVLSSAERASVLADLNARHGL